MRALAVLTLALTAALAASAQEQRSPMQGFSINRDKPVKIEAATLEVRDKQRQATFSGGVTLTQGDTILKCKALVVFYEDTAAAGGKKGAPQAQKAGPTSGQQIKRAEAKGDVFVTQNDQTASGDNGVFDLKSNTITLTGNVVVTQGGTVMHGSKMVVELETGIVKVTDPRMVAAPSAAKDATAAPVPPPQQQQPAKLTPRPPGKAKAKAN
jgi:lipopolysaccharide export system protein LptA